MSRIGEPGFSYADPIAVGAIISQIFPFIVLFSRIDLQQRCQPPPVSAHPVCCDRSRGTPRHENTGGCIQVDGGEHSPPDPNAQTNDTRDSTQQSTANAQSAAQDDRKCFTGSNECRRPAGSRGTRQALTPPHQMEPLTSNGSAALPPPDRGSSPPTPANPPKERGGLRRDDDIGPPPHQLGHRLDQLDG